MKGRAAPFVLLALFGCASNRAEVANQESTVGVTPTARPPILARELSLPEPALEAEARGTSVLRPAQDLRSAEPIARAFLDALVDEDLRQLTALFVPSGGQFLSGGLGASNPVELWRQRFRLYDYGRLRGQPFARLSEATLARRAEYEKKDLPLSVENGDVFFRVPLVAPQGPGEPVLGSSVTLLLRQTNAGTKIVGYDEGRSP